MIETLQPHAKTIPDNYQVKPIEVTYEGEPGHTIGEDHWRRAALYETVIEQAMGMEYEEFAAKVTETLEVDDEEAKALWVNYDQATAAQRKAYHIAFGIKEDEVDSPEDYLDADDTGGLECTELEDLQEIDGIRNKPLDFN